MSNTNRTRQQARRIRIVRAAALAAVAALLWSAAPAMAGPKGARVAKGSAKVETRGNDTVIRASDRAVINYSSFDLARGETVNFVQPSASARVLNRIDGGVPSRIDGAIRANGRVYFVNPSGIVFGAGSSVQAAGFVAAAANLSDADFIAGVDRFTGGSGLVSNAGTIRTDGLAALIGGRVENTGAISGNVVALVAGGETYLSTKNSKLMVNVSGGTGGSAPAVRVGGTASAKKQFVVGAGDLYSLAVKTTGTVTSPDVDITAAPSKLGGTDPVGVVEIGGTIDASSARGRGGDVAITGDYVSVPDATIDVRGPRGGGVVQVGGGWQGGGDLAHAKATSIGADATIHADAISKGDGGVVAVWSDGVTNFYGTVSATGGPRGGDGGSVETSGVHLAALGNVDTTAVDGAVGEYLLDPGNIIIVGSQPTANPAGGVFTVPDGGFFEGSDTAQSILGAVQIANALLNSNVTISTRVNRFNPTAEQLASQELLTAYVRDVIQPNTGTILLQPPLAGGTIRSEITYTGAADRVLTFRANAGISIGSDIRATGSGKLTVELRAREGYRYFLDALPAAVKGPEFSEAMGAVFVDDNIYGNLLSSGISFPDAQGVKLGVGSRATPITIDTNGGNFIASGRFVRSLFQDTSFTSAELGTVLEQANIFTRGGRVDFRASGEINVGNIDTRARVASGRGGDISLFSSQSYFPTKTPEQGASVAGTPGSIAQVIFQSSGTTIDAGDGNVHLRGGAVILSGDALRGGHVLVQALGYIDAQGKNFENSDIVIRDFVADELFARDFGFKTTLDPDAPTPTLDQLRAAITAKRDGTGPGDADPTFRAYAIEAKSVELRGDVRANAELQLGINATRGDLTIGRLVRTGRAGLVGDGAIVSREIGGALDGNAYVTLSALNGTVRVEEAIGALDGRVDVNTAGTAAPPPNRLNIIGKEIELATVLGGGYVNVEAQDAIRVVGKNPVWLSATGDFNVNRKPTFDRETLDAGSVAPIYASPNFELDPNGQLYEFDLRQSVPVLFNAPSTFTPFQFADPSGVETYLSVTFSGVAVTAAEEIAGATPQQTRGFEPSGAISNDIARTLSQVGVRIRDVRSDELLESLFGRGYYDDVAGGPITSRPASRRVYEIDPDSIRSDSQVAKPRVPAGTAERVVAKFNEVAMRPARDPETGAVVVGANGLPVMESRGDEIREHLGKTVDAYLAQNPGEIDPAKLRAFIDTDPGQAATAKDVRGLQDLLRLIGQLGLAPAEERQARNTTVGLAQPEQIDRPVLERVIDPNARK